MDIHIFDTVVLPHLYLSGWSRKYSMLLCCSGRCKQSRCLDESSFTAHQLGLEIIILTIFILIENGVANTSHLPPPSVILKDATFGVFFFFTGSDLYSCKTNKFNKCNFSRIGMPY